MKKHKILDWWGILEERQALYKNGKTFPFVHRMDSIDVETLSKSGFQFPILVNGGLARVNAQLEINNIAKIIGDNESVPVVDSDNQKRLKEKWTMKQWID